MTGSLRSQEAQESNPRTTRKNIPFQTERLKSAGLGRINIVRTIQYLCKTMEQISHNERDDYSRRRSLQFNCSEQKSR